MIVSRPRAIRLGWNPLSDRDMTDIQHRVEQGAKDGARDGMKQGLDEKLADPATVDQIRALIDRAWTAAGPRVVADARREFLAPLKTTAVVAALLGVAGWFGLAAGRASRVR